jgi:transposase
MEKSGNKSQLARDLGIHSSLLRKWEKKIEENGKNPFPGKGKPQNEELSQLRRENALLLDPEKRMGAGEKI